MTNLNVSLRLTLVDQFTQHGRGIRDTLNSIKQSAEGLQRVFAGGSSMGRAFTSMQSQARALGQELRSLNTQFSQLSSTIGRSSGGGSFVQRQISDLRQVLTLQQQAIANNARMVAGPGGGGRFGGSGGGFAGGGFLGRSGFSPNASIQDRLQYRGVNMLERSFTEGFIQTDLARARLHRLDLPPAEIAEMEHRAAALNQQFRELTKGDILETFGEIVTQFGSTADAFRALPYLLRTQQLDIQAGRNRTGGRDSMLRLVRMVGLTGKLTGANGEFTENEASAVLDAFLRAREIGGADVNAEQGFQLVKYLKMAGQTLSPSALRMAFIGMPDLRASSFGNQLAMLIRSLPGARTTKEALQAQAEAGLRTATIDPRHPAGPNKLRPGPLVDSELMRENPFDWWDKHILGPQGFLQRRGLDWRSSRPAALAEAVAPLFGNMSAENMASMFTLMQGEWRTQDKNAQALNRGYSMFATHDERGRPLPTTTAATGSFWDGLMQARAQLVNAMTAVATNFNDILLPPLFKVAEGLSTVAQWTDPRTGSPILNMGLLGGGAVGAFMLLRALARSMGPLGRTHAGGGLGLMFGGGITEALMGGLMMRGFGGGAAAAGAAGAAAAATWRSRFLAGLFGLGRLMRSMTIWGAVSSGLYAIVENWEAIAVRLKAIWADLSNALPSFLGGQGAGGGSVEMLRQDAQGWGKWFRGTDLGQWMVQSGYLINQQQAAAIFAQQGANRLLGAGIPQGFLPPGMQSQALPPGWRAGGPVTINVGGVTVNVAQSNADPNAIGEAAGNAVGARLRQYLADVPDGPY